MQGNETQEYISELVLLDSSSEDDSDIQQNTNDNQV